MNSEFCLKCDSQNIEYFDCDNGEGIEGYVCNDCGEYWRIDENDPDDDLPLSEEEFIDSGLVRHIERYAMYGRLPNDQN